MQIPQPNVPLYQSPIGLGTGPTPLSLNVQLPQQDFGPQLAMAEFENRLNQRTIELGFQLSQAAIEASEDAIVSREIRRIVMGDQDGETIRQRAAQIVSNNVIPNLRNEQGGPLFDATQIGQEITSIQELEEALIAMDFESWDEVIKAAIPALEERAMSNMGILGRGRVRRWIQDRSDEIRSKYALEAAQRHQQITMSMYEQELKTNIESGNVDGAYRIIDLMQYHGIVGLQRADLMRLQALEQAPVQKIINEISASMAQGASDTVVREVLQKYQQRVGPETVPVEDETGKIRFTTITQNQFDVIADNIERRMADRNRIQQQLDNQRIQEIDAELQKEFETGGLTDSYLQNLNLLDEQKEQFTRLHRYWRAVLDNENENSRRQALALRDASAQAQLDQFELQREASRNELISQLYSESFNGILSAAEIRGRIAEMHTERDPNGVPLFEHRELARLQTDLLSMVNNPDININAQIMQEVEGVLQSRVTGSGQQREAMLRQKNRDMEIFTRGMNALEGQLRVEAITITEYEDALKALQDRVLSIGEELSTWEVILDGQVMNVDSTLTYEGVARVGQDSNISRAENLISQGNYIESLRSAQAGAFALPTQEAEVAASRIQQAAETAFQGMFSHYLGDARRTYLVRRDNTNNTVIRESASMMGVLQSDINQNDLSRYLSDDPQGRAMFSFQMRIDPDNRNRPTMAIRDEVSNQWVFVNRLSQEQQQILGLVPTFALPERQPVTFAPTTPDEVPRSRTSIPTRQAAPSASEQAFQQAEQQLGRRIPRR